MSDTTPTEMWRRLADRTPDQKAAVLVRALELASLDRHPNDYAARLKAREEWIRRALAEGYDAKTIAPPNPPPPPRRHPTDGRTEAERVAQIIRHQALGHAVRWCAGMKHMTTGELLSYAVDFAEWIERGGEDR